LAEQMLEEGVKARPDSAEPLLVLEAVQQLGDAPARNDYGSIQNQ
jgi:hypothetical protein